MRAESGGDVFVAASSFRNKLTRWVRLSNLRPRRHEVPSVPFPSNRRGNFQTAVAVSAFVVMPAHQRMQECKIARSRHPWPRRSQESRPRLGRKPSGRRAFTSLPSARMPKMNRWARQFPQVPDMFENHMYFETEIKSKIVLLIIELSGDSRTLKT